MATIVRDRVRDAIGRKMSLEQVKAARLVRDYEGASAHRKAPGRPMRSSRRRIAVSARRVRR